MKKRALLFAAKLLTGGSAGTKWAREQQAREQTQRPTVRAPAVA